MAKKAKDALSNPPDFLTYLSADDALAILRLLARDEAVASRIREVTETYLKCNAPHVSKDVETIAGDVRRELEGLEVEEVWDRAGRTSAGYVEPSEVADEMIQRALDPFLEQVTRYQRLGMSLEGMYVCMALLQGLYEFEHNSNSQFKDWATDLPSAYAEIALERWQAGKPIPSARKKMRNFIQAKLLRWEVALERLLTSERGGEDERPSLSI